MTEQNPKLPFLRKKALDLPLMPGVYLMHDKAGKIIYVGKAKALKNRVSQYFGSDKNHQEKVRQMILHVDKFEYLVTDSEFEALVLENSLIKQHQPKYNILLKDDKGYSYIRIGPGDFPRIRECKQTAKDGARYLGPYMSSWSVKQTVDEAHKIFLLPNCTRRFPQDFGKGRPCLNFFIQQCCAPCRGKITAAEYREIMDDALAFIMGESSIVSLTQRMEAAAEALNFELAGRLRDRIAAIRKVQEKQKMVDSRIPEQDVIALASGEGKRALTILKYQKHRFFDRQDFLFAAEEPEELRAEFIRQYYDGRAIPPQITVDGPVADGPLLTQWLTEKAGYKVTLHLPQKGDQLRLVELCRLNAAEKLSQSSVLSGRELSALDELGRLLGLPAPPAYIEAYDISNLAGSENVGAMVVFENGRPLRAAYRKFKIKTVVGQDDYGSMREVLERRFLEYEVHKASGQGFGRLPDLILLDGGKGHVSAVAPLLHSMGITVPLFGMVKDDKHRTRAIAATGGEIAIASTRKAFTFVSRLQDEVHRFAIGFHQARRKKGAVASSLLGIEGIGESRAQALMKTFRTMRAISLADKEELAAVPGMTKSSAQKLWNFFHKEET